MADTSSTSTSSAHASPLNVRICEALRALNPNNRAALDVLRTLYDDAVYFEDPIQKVNGLEGFIEMNQRLLARARDLQFTTQPPTGSDTEFFFAWTMRLVPKFGPKAQMDGVTHIRSKDGKVTYHRDYWDIAAMFASLIPGGKQALGLLLRPLA